ncbi:MAG: enoyl-CoA hydratase/isomerase family protein, partial [Paracoccaceae bacterium]
MTLLDGGIVGISVNNPPANALGPAVRQALWDALETAEADPGLRVVLIEAEGPNFSTGTDVTEDGAAPAPPTLSELCDRVEACAKPVVAVLQGRALGEGFELALAAHYRLALEGAHVGLPGVTLGLVPGAGGTQRLPRLAGGAAALEIMLAGRPVPAAEALRLGLIDRVA